MNVVLFPVTLEHYILYITLHRWDFVLSIYVLYYASSIVWAVLALWLDSIAYDFQTAHMVMSLLHSS